MRWFGRPQPTQTQSDAQAQANWSDRSRAIGEGRILGPQVGFQSVQPGFFQRLGKAIRPGGVEYRTIESLPWSVGGSLPQPSTQPTADSALALGAVYASVSLLARTIAGLPLHAYREVGGKKTELPQLPPLFDEPSVQGDLFDWLHRCMTSLCLHGNAFGLITNRDGFGYPTGIEWLSPEHMTVVDFAFTGPGSFLDPIWRWRGRVIPRDNLVHIAWFTRPWKVLGLSPLQAYAASINTGLGAQKFSADWFDAGGVPPGTFKNALKTVPPSEAQQIKQRLVDSIRTHQPIVYGADWDYNPIAINPQEAQFIETMKLTATNVAAIYGVPPDRVGGEKSSSLTYSTVEQDSIDFVQFTILNYARKLESAFFKVLPARQYVRFNLDALIRTDTLTRHKIYMLDRQMGLRSIPEIRELEDLPPIKPEDEADYAPLLTTGVAPVVGTEPENQPTQLSEPQNLPLRLPYQDVRTLNGNGNGHRQMTMPMDISVPVSITIPQPQFTVEHRAGDVIVQPSAPPDVRVELPVTLQASDVTVNVPEREVTLNNQIQPANAPEVSVPVTVQAAAAPEVRVEAPITVNTPEVQVQAPDVNVAPAVVNVAMPKPEPPPDVEVLDGSGKVISRTRRVKAK